MQRIVEIKLAIDCAQLGRVKVSAFRAITLVNTYSYTSYARNIKYSSLALKSDGSPLTNSVRTFVCKHEQPAEDMTQHTHIYIYIYIYKVVNVSSFYLQTYAHCSVLFTVYTWYVYTSVLYTWLQSQERAVIRR